MSRKHSILEIGERFNRLVVSGGPVFMATPTESRPNRKETRYRCVCDCGKEHSVTGSDLRNGQVKSCGCLRSAKSSERAKARNRRHGHAVRGEARPPEYNVWANMKSRCHDTGSKDYPRYGGRGIFVCERWRESFSAFYADMGPRPSGLYKIERNDNDGPYSPINCRWATAKEQAENRRNNVFLEHDGKRLTLMEWSRVVGIGVTTLSYRIKAGWPVERALTTPNDAYHLGTLSVARSNSVYLEHDGRRLPQGEWARIIGIPRQALAARIKRGWSIADALSTPFGQSPGTD